MEIWDKIMRFQRFILQILRIKCENWIKKMINWDNKPNVVIQINIVFFLQMTNVAERLMLGKLKKRILKTFKKLNWGQVMLKGKLKIAYKQLSYHSKESSTDIENSEQEYEDIVEDVPEPKNLSDEDIIESNLKIFRFDIYANLQLVPQKKKYTMLTKIYSYCLYIKS